MFVRNLPRQPFVGLTLAAALGIVAADYSPLAPALLPCLLAAIVLIALPLLRWPRAALTYVFVAAALFLLHELRIVATPGQYVAGLIGPAPCAVNVEGTVSSEPKFSASGFASFILQLRSIEAAGQTIPTNASIFTRWHGQPTFGDELKLFGVAQPTEGPRNPGEFDMRGYLVRRDIRDVVIVRYAENGQFVRHNSGNRILGLAQKTRGWMQHAIGRGLDDAPDVQTFLSGIVLGARHQAPEDIEEPFQQTGTLHLFAVAGLHVGIVARLLWILTTTLQISRRWAPVLIIPLLLFYAAITGLHVSSMRAALMTSILIGGFVIERRAFSLNSLAAAAFLLLSWDTNELFSTGFQLSFAVVGAIILFAEPLAKLLQRWTAADPFLPARLISRPRRAFHSGVNFIGHGLALSTAAWLGSIVLVVRDFHLIAPISLLANLVVVPIAFFILAIAMLSVICTPLLPSLALLLNQANWCLASLVIAIVHFFARLPAGHFYTEAPAPSDHAVTEINVLDVGAGGAVHIRAGNAEWLFDCGGERDYERTVRPYLHARGVNHIDGLLLSHGDSLHIGGVPLLVHDLRPSRILDNPAPDHSRVHHQIINALRESNLPVRHARAGNEIVLAPNVVAKVLFPPPYFYESVADRHALVVQLCTPSARALLMSDGGDSTERALLHAGVDLRSDVIIKGKSRSDPFGTDEFLDAVRPTLIVATSRDFPGGERIDDAWADRIHQRGITLFRQDQSGAVEIRCRDNNWSARAYLTGETLRSSTR